MTRRHFGSLRKLPSGGWQARYEYDGRVHVGSTTFSTKSDALVYLSTVETDIHGGTWISPRAGKLILEDLAAQWLVSDPSKRPSTLATDGDALRLHILPVIGDRRVTRVTRRDVQQLVNSWTAAHSPRTVRRTYGVLRAVLAFAASSDLIARSPCRNVKLPKVTVRTRHALTADE